MVDDGVIVMGLTPCGLYEVVLRPGKFFYVFFNL